MFRLQFSVTGFCSPPLVLSSRGLNQCSALASARPPSRLALACLALRARLRLRLRMVLTRSDFAELFTRSCFALP
eukprot:2580640-Rhodomonas_salina.2